MPPTGTTLCIRSDANCLRHFASKSHCNHNHCNNRKLKRRIATMHSTGTTLSRSSPDQSLWPPPSNRIQKNRRPILHSNRTDAYSDLSRKLFSFFYTSVLWTSVVNVLPQGYICNKIKKKTRKESIVNISRSIKRRIRRAPVS